MRSLERPIASDSSSVQSTPNPNVITAAAAPITEEAEEDKEKDDAADASPSPSRERASVKREGSSATSSARQRPDGSPSRSVTGSDVATESTFGEVPPPLASGPPQRPHSNMGGTVPTQQAEEKTPNEALVKSKHGSPTRPLGYSQQHHSEGGSLEQTKHMSINIGTATKAGSRAGRTRADGTGGGNGGNQQTTTVGFYESSPEARRQGSVDKRPSPNSSLPRSRQGESPMVDAVYAATVRSSVYTAAGQRKMTSESIVNDSRLYTTNISTTSATDVNNSGYTPSQRALVQYGASPADMATPSYAYRESVTARSDGGGGYSPSRHAEIRAMLIAAERELADAREECAKRGMKVEALESALDRERANTRTMRDRYAEEAVAAREEHESVTRQLRDQLHVLKMISESAMAEKSKMAEEAGRRKKELLALLDREREEKSYIMADYREQTESLIAEQGREITSLRAALDKLKENYDALAKQHQTSEDERESLAEKLEAMTSQLDRERAEASSRIRDMQANMEQECSALREQLEVRQEQLQRSVTQQVKKQQDLADQLQKSEERQRVAEEEHQHALEALKQAYRKDTEGLQEELQRLKESRDKHEEELRREVEKATKREVKSVEALRQALEQVRKEKEACVDDNFQQREALQRQHREKVTTLQGEVDVLTQQLGEERTARKDAEAESEVLRVRAESLDKANQRLSSELEAAQAEQRSKDRTAEQAHQAVVEELRAKIRTTSTDLSYAQDQLTQLAADAQQLRDEMARRTSALEATKEKLAKQEMKFTEEMARMKDAAVQKERETTQVISQMRTSKAQLEATCERLERQAKDAEGRVQGTVKQVEEERRSLEEVHRRLQDTKVEAEDLRVVVAHTQERIAAMSEEKQRLEQQLEDAKLYRDELENALHNGERKLMEQQQEHARQLKQMEGRLEEQSQRHSAELAAVRMASEQVRGEVARAREAIVEKEAALQQMREEVGKLHREAALREGGLQEDMEDLREAHELEMRRMDELLNGLRSDLAKSQAMCTQYQRELSHMHRNSEGERSDLEVALQQADAARAKLLEDAKYRDQLNRELQGTVRLLSSRLTANEEEVRRVQEELAETNKKIQDAHTLIGRKDAAIGQLNAKLRAYEARSGTSIAL
jgi:chromosome segregation ATPase